MTPSVRRNIIPVGPCKVEALKVDLDAKSRAATAGWDAAANAESEAEAAEARGLQAGVKRGRAEADRKASVPFVFQVGLHHRVGA